MLLAIYGATIGRIGLTSERSSCNQAALGLRARPGTATTEYLWFVAVDLQEHLVGVAQGAAQQNVSKQKVAAAPALSPPPDVIERFTLLAGPPWRLSHEVTRQSRVLSEIRDLLLPKLVTGQIDVSKLDLDAVLEGAGL